MVDQPADPIDSYRAAVNPHQVEVLDQIGLLRTFIDAAGEYVVDSSGRRYLDLSASHGAALLGHRHPRLVEALCAAIRDGGPFVVPVGLPSRAGDLAQRLCQLAGEPLRRVYFCTGGSEAIENAMKFAMAATGRRGFVGFTGGFHGFTCGPLPLADHRFWRSPLPHWEPGDRHIVQFGEPDQLAKVLATNEVAAVIVEAVQGFGGARVWPADQLGEVRRICAAHGTLLIVDEILTGIGRTGRWFAFQHAGISPDIVVVSKGLSGAAVPVAAVIMTQPVHESVFSSPARAFVHGSTFHGHLLGMTAGLTVLATLQEENLLAKGAHRGAQLIAGLAAIRQADIGLTGVRGQGMLLAFQVRGLTHDQSTDGAAACMSALHRRGVLVESALHDQSWLRLTPPLTMSEQSVDVFLTALQDCLRELAAHRPPGSRVVGEQV